MAIVREFNLQVGGDQDEPVRFVRFAAPEHEAFVPNAHAAVEAIGIDARRYFGLGTVVAYLDVSEVRLEFIVENTDTVSDVYRLLGPDAAVVPAALGLKTAGYGGGGADWMQYLYVAKALAGDAVTVAGIAGLMFAAFKKARAMQYRHSRELVLQWAAQGEVPPELVERVRSGSWFVSDAREEFGLDDFKLGELFRACGMDYVAADGGGFWTRP